MVKKAAQATPNERLIRARLERGWTQKDVADRVGAPLNLNVNRWERGTARPSAYYVQRLCEVFGKSASELGLLPLLPQFEGQETMTGDKAGHASLVRFEASGPSSESEPKGSSKDLPTGTITLLFIDMVESTHLLQQLGAGYTELLADYRQIVRTTFGQWNGYEVDTQGDAFFVVFARALDAITAAVAIQRALIAHSWTENVTVLARIGLHTGEPQLSSEGYVGLDVHHAARIMSAGHPGQILLSQTTHDLIKHTVAEDMFLRDLGEHSLKDLQQPTHLFQLGCTDLPTDFPPPKSLNTPLWNVPFSRNPFFTGRSDILERLNHHMQRSRSAALTSSQALVGLGGIGKTQIAIEYAYRYREHYSSVFWIRAATLETLVTDYVSLAFLLRLPGQDSQDQMRIVAATRDWFAQHKKWLLILDNADELSLLTDFLPMGGDGHLLLITQAQATGRIAESFPVDKLEMEESLLLLLRRAKLLSLVAPLASVSPTVLQSACAIVEELDGLPLALDQAAAYVEETGCSLADYLQLYRKQRLVMLNRQSHVSADYPRTVASTWSLSFAQVEQASPTAADLLRLCAFLHPDAIPEVFLTEGAEHLDAALFEAVSDPFSLNEMLQLLRRYSLVKRDPEAKLLNIHRLVQVVLKESLSREGRRQWAERTVRLINAVFPEISFDVWVRCELCLPQVQACFELINEYDLVLPEAARLLHQAGCYLRERGLYQRAEELLRRAVAISERVLGLEHPETATMMTDLGELYWSQGKYAAAETIYQHAFTIYEKTLEMRHAKTATVLNNLGMLYAEQGRYEQAEPLLQQALSIREQVFEGNHSDVAEGLNNVAWVYYKQGKYEQAEPLYERALHLREQLLGPQHPRTAESLDNLAIIYRYQGKYKQAEALHQRAFAIYEHELGSEHPDTAVSLLAQGLLQQARHHYEQAQALYERALSIFERSLGPTHPRVAQTLYYLGQLAAAQQQYERAEALYQQSLHIREHALRAQHPDTLQGREALAEIQSTRQELASPGQ